MKIIGLFAILGIAYAQNWELGETGLCIQRQATCPTRVQRYGVCCTLKGQPRYFSNFCLACQAGCEEWKYLLTSDQKCT